MCHPEIIEIAHTKSSRTRSLKLAAYPKKVMDIADFRHFLLHLFAISVIIVHFKKADEWGSGHNIDMSQNILSLEEFRLAVRSFCHAHAQEHLSDEDIDNDFKILDVNGNGALNILQVSIYYVNSCAFIFCFVTGIIMLYMLRYANSVANLLTQLSQTDCFRSLIVSSSSQKILKLTKMVKSLKSPLRVKDILSE